MQPIVDTAVRLALRHSRALLVTLALASPALGQDTASLPPVVVHPEGQKVKFSGVLIDRHGDEMRVRDNNTMHIVRLTNGTKIETPSGFLKLDRIRRDTSALMRGLRLKVEGRGAADGAVVAEEIKFSATSFRTAEQISGGEVVLRDSIERAKERARDSLERVNKRITNIDVYDEKASTTVNFNTASAVLSDQAKRSLDDLVRQSANWKGYMFEVTGYADTTGTEAYNRDLSERRAESVVAYLTEVHRVPLRRILNPTGHGTAQAIASNMTPTGRAMNRRALVRVLVNRGITNPPQR